METPPPLFPEQEKAFIFERFSEGLVKKLHRALLEIVRLFPVSEEIKEAVDKALREAEEPFFLWK